MLQLLSVAIDKPDTANFILGQTHFIKSVEDIHEALVASASRSARRPASASCAIPAPAPR